MLQAQLLPIALRNDATRLSCIICLCNQRLLGVFEPITPGTYNLEPDIQWGKPSGGEPLASPGQGEGSAGVPSSAAGRLQPRDRLPLPQLQDR